jgi:hypothetical protein
VNPAPTEKLLCLCLCFCRCPLFLLSFCTLSAVEGGRNLRLQFHTSPLNKNVISTEAAHIPHPKRSRRGRNLQLQLHTSPPQQKRHLDRSRLQSHRERRSGETPYFAFALAVAFLVVIPAGDLRLLLPLPALLLSFCSAAKESAVAVPHLTPSTKTSSRPKPLTVSS